MRYDVIRDEISFTGKGYAISGMVNAIITKYPEMLNSQAFKVVQDEIIDYTMSMDACEQQDEMIRIMCKMIENDYKAKKENDIMGRVFAARGFLAAVSLHPYYVRLIEVNV